MTGNPAPTVLLTRPRAQAEAYAADLKHTLGQGLQVAISPLIEIRHLSPRLDLRGIGTLLFTSANGVEAYARLTSDRTLPALCVGERSAERARALGFQAEAAGGDAASLADLARRRGKGGFLYLRGAHVAGDLAGALSDSARDIRELIVYRQDEQPLSHAAHRLIKAGSPIILPLFSPRSAGLFMGQTGDADLGHITAVCISPNVARALTGAQLGGIRIARHTDAASVTREIAALL